MSQTKSKKLDTTVLTLAVLGSLVFVNIVGLSLFGRLDLTRDGQFTLSDATLETLKNLKDPITVKAYFTSELPGQYASNARYVKDLLDEYYNHADGNFRYEFVDPKAEETAEDKEKKKDIKTDIFGRAVREATSVEKELQSLGIPSVPVMALQDDRQETIMAYMGIAITYQGESEVIPVVQDTGSLEYDLTTLMRKLTREKTPKVAVATGFGGPSVDMNPEDPAAEALSQLYGLLGQLYDVTTLNLESNPQIPEDVDALIVVGPKNPVSQEAKRAIDAFVLSGRSVAFLVDGVKPKLSMGITEPANSDLDDLLAHYGVKLESGLVLDPECAPIATVQQRGFLRMQQQVPYPYIPLVKTHDPANKLTRGIPQAIFPFVRPLSVLGVEGVQAEVLVQSSDKSWVRNAPYDLDPNQRWTIDDGATQRAYPLVVSLSGAIPSFFQKGDAVASGEEPGAAASQGARVLVAGSASFITDQFMSQPAKALALNLVDWLVQDEALLAIRARGLGAPPIDDVPDAEKTGIKVANILGLPLLFAAFGLFRWRRRETKRKNVTI